MANLSTKSNVYDSIIDTEDEPSSMYYSINNPEDKTLEASDIIEIPDDSFENNKTLEDQNTRVKKLWNNDLFNAIKEKNNEDSNILRLESNHTQSTAKAFCSTPNKFLSPSKKLSNGLDNDGHFNKLLGKKGAAGVINKENKENIDSPSIIEVNQKFHGLTLSEAPEKVSKNINDKAKCQVLIEQTNNLDVLEKKSPPNKKLISDSAVKKKVEIKSPKKLKIKSPQKIEIKSPKKVMMNSPRNMRPKKVVLSSPKKANDNNLSKKLDKNAVKKQEIVSPKKKLEIRSLPPKEKATNVSDTDNKSKLTKVVKFKHTFVSPNEPDLTKNRPSRISNIKNNFLSKPIQIIDHTMIRLKSILNHVEPKKEIIPASIREPLLKVKKPIDNNNDVKSIIEKRRTIHANYTFANKRRSSIKQSSTKFNEFNPVKRSRISMAKTTLNSPATARKNIRKTMHNMKHDTKDGVRKSVMVRPPPPSILKKTIPFKSIEKPNLSIPKKPIPSILKKSNPDEILIANKTKSETLITSKEDNILTANTIRKTAMKLPKSIYKITCTICNKDFELRQMYEDHVKMHAKQLKKSVKTLLICKFCDKEFAIRKALDIHLLEKCTKITSAEKKKLFILTPARAANTGSHVNFNLPYDKRSQNNARIITKATTGSQTCDVLVVNNENETTPLNTAEHNEDTKMMMLPPQSASSLSLTSSLLQPLTSSAIKSKIPHSGVYSTPSKLLHCRSCKLTFNNILAYTEHILSHSQ